jgi:hypothetical protein
MTESGTGVQPIDYAVPRPPRRRSGAGRVSFAIAIAAVAVLLAVFAAINGRPASDPTAYKLFALSLILPAAGTVFGVVALCQPWRYRGLAVAGLILNVMMVLCLLLAVVPSLLHELGFWR